MSHAAGYRDGLKEAHRLLRNMHDNLEREHIELSGAFFGLFPRRRHHQIIGASRALCELGFEVLKAHARDVAEGATAVAQDDR